jgi:glycosyltransferase involved in cell wall biosynthesis
MIRTAFVSSYPPQHCGVATFTHHLAAAVGGREIVALHAADLPTPYPLEVHHRIRRDDPEDYLRTARGLRACADVVSVQHRFDIWGGEDGGSVLDFVQALDVPAVATLHGVPGSPTRNQRLVLAELVRRTAATVVLSRSAEKLLTRTYGVDPLRLEVIPHGIPDLPLAGAATVKPAVGMAGREVILSFGLLGPGKGCELALTALPAVVAARPTAMYVILGATQPGILRREGEAHRESLVSLVAELGMGGHVQFVDRFVGRVELTRWLQAADVIVAPYADPGQTVAGTLAYAMGAGRAVVATPFAHALELLANGRGVIVPPADAAALAMAIVALLADPDERAAIGRRAHEDTRSMTWWHVAAQYRDLFGRVLAGRSMGRAALPTVALGA